MLGATADSDSDCIESDDDGYEDGYYEEEDIDAMQDTETKVHDRYLLVYEKNLDSLANILP